MMEEESPIDEASPEEVKSQSTNVNVCSNKICKLYKATKYNLGHENNPTNLCGECKMQYSK